MAPLPENLPSLTSLWKEVDGFTINNAIEFLRDEEFVNTENVWQGSFVELCAFGRKIDYNKYVEQKGMKGYIYIYRLVEILCKEFHHEFNRNNMSSWKEALTHMWKFDKLGRKKY